MSVEGELHAQPSTSRDSLGTPSCSWGYAGATRSCAWDDADPATDSRAPVWHDQGMDGSHSFPNSNHWAGKHGNELARACIQHQASDQDTWFRSCDEGDASVMLAGLLILGDKARRRLWIRHVQRKTQLAPRQRFVNSSGCAFWHGLGHEGTFVCDRTETPRRLVPPWYRPFHSTLKRIGSGSCAVSLSGSVNWIVPATHLGQRSSDAPQMLT